MVRLTVRNFEHHPLNRQLPGFVIGPLQQYYIGEENFKLQTNLNYGLYDATDVFDFFCGNHDGDHELSTARLRSELASVSTQDFQPNLWQEGTPQCTANASENFHRTSECFRGGTTFDNITLLLGPYIAQFPAGYQTGLITQFLPRMNSSVSYANVAQMDFPRDCATLPAAYFIEYSYNKTVLNVQICMPTDVSVSPWKATRDRQEISEEMYMKITMGFLTGTTKPATQTFKVVVNTTLGYFELPNYKSSSIAGPLLAKDRTTYYKGKTGDCLSQWSYDKRSLPQHQQRKSQNLPLKRSVQVNEGTNSSTLGRTVNLGPLTRLTLAMFDPGSFIATQFTNIGPTPSEDHRPVASCTVAPLEMLLRNLHFESAYPCYPQPHSQARAVANVATWLLNFNDIKGTQNALHAGVILASLGWLNSFSGSLGVQYDFGSDFLRPKISTTGVVLLSILLGVDLFFLLALGAYASFSYTWTSSYNSLAMMRQGAARADRLGLHVWEEEAKQVLETMPGWVGDAAPDEDVGVLAIGAKTPLKKRRKYIRGTLG